jgi:hypothetical protein
MDRVLVVLHGPIDISALRERLANAQRGVAGAHELAVCHVLTTGADGVCSGIRAQRELTAALRQALGAKAETMAVFVASEHGGYSVEDCVRDWGATVVLP